MAFKQGTHDIVGTPFYFGSIRLRRHTEFYHTHPTFEIDGKFRWGLSHIYRVPFTTFGVFFGRWTSATSSEEEAVLSALSGRPIDDPEEYEKIKGRARGIVAANAQSMDDEWELVRTLGLE